jgi:hypothetical protein
MNEGRAKEERRNSEGRTKEERNDKFGKGCNERHSFSLSITIKRRHKHIIFFGH